MDELTKYIKDRQKSWRGPGAACCMLAAQRSAVQKELKLILQKIEELKSSETVVENTKNTGHLVLNASECLIGKEELQDWVDENKPIVSPPKNRLGLHRCNSLNIGKKSREIE